MGRMTLAWHTAMAPRWLDPQEHDGTATPDNFLMALHDALIKNSGTTLYDHPASPSATSLPRMARAPPSGCARASSSTTASRSPPRTSSSATRTTAARSPPPSRPRPRPSTSSTSAPSASASRSRSWISCCCWAPAMSLGAGWVVPAKYYQQVGPDGFKRKPIGAGPYKLASHGAGREDRSSRPSSTITGLCTSRT